MNEGEQKHPYAALSDLEVQELWDRFYPRLKSSIAARIRRIRRPVANESEIALSAFNSMVQRAKAGEFSELTDESSFWRLLRTIALRKANDVHKKLWADKRGGKRGAMGQHEFDSDDGIVAGINAAVARTPDASADLEVHELFTELLQNLPSDRHRDVILLKLQGADTQVISECLGTTNRTVQRLLKGIRDEWEAEINRTR